jgi:hypothetical protein
MIQIVRSIISVFFVYCSTLVLTLVLFNAVTASDRGNPNFGDLNRGMAYLICFASFGISAFLMWALQVFVLRMSKSEISSKD